MWGGVSLLMRVVWQGRQMMRLRDGDGLVVGVAVGGGGVLVLALRRLRLHNSTTWTVD